MVNQCRVCLDKSPVYKSIFSVYDDYGISYAEIINISISAFLVPITQGDGLPDKICACCSEKVTEFHKFKLKFENNQLILKSGIEKSSDEVTSSKVNPIILTVVNIQDILDAGIHNIDEDCESNQSNEGESCDINEKNNDEGKEEGPVLIKQEENTASTDKEHEKIEDKTPGFDKVIIKDEVMDEESNSEGDNQDIDPEDDQEYIEKKPLKCPHCPKRFAYRYMLKRHIVVHSDRKAFKCELCNKGFRTEKNLQRHLLMHTGEKPFECEYCDKKFTQKKYLTSHLLNHSNKLRFECDQCDKKFLRKASLQDHFLSHTDAKQFECELCNTKFRRKGTLRNHMLLTHKAETPFECEECKKRFKHRKSLQSHLLIHSGEKPFECEHCKKLFRYKNNFQKHLLSHRKLPSLEFVTVDSTNFIKSQDDGIS